MTTRKIVLPTCVHCPHRDHAGAFGNPAHKPVCRLGKRDLPYNEVAHNGRAHAQATEVIPDWCPLGVDQSTQSLISALEKIATFKPKSAADCNDMANERNQFRAELAALKFELEVARTDELSAAVWAATETIKHDLWDAQAEIVKRDAQIATQEAQIKALQSGENCWQSGYDEGRLMGAKHCTGTIDQLRAELAALNAKLDASKFCADVADDLLAELADAKETISRYEVTAENCDVLRAELANQLEVKSFWIGRTRALEVELAEIAPQQLSGVRCDE